MTFDGIEIGLSECSNDGTIHGKFEGSLLDDCIGLLFGIELGTNGGYELGF